MPYPNEHACRLHQPSGRRTRRVNGEREHEGKRYAYCCDGCLDMFKADPAKYIAAKAAPSCCSHAGHHGAHGSAHEHHHHAQAAAPGAGANCA